MLLVHDNQTEITHLKKMLFFAIRLSGVPASNGAPRARSVDRLLRHAIG